LALGAAALVAAISGADVIGHAAGPAAARSRPDRRDLQAWTDGVLGKVDIAGRAESGPTPHADLAD